MSSGVDFSNQAIGALAVRSMNIALMAQIMQQQRVAGAAMVEMINGNPAPPAAARSQPRSEAPPPEPVVGAAEPGKGGLVDVVA